MAFETSNNVCIICIGLAKIVQCVLDEHIHRVCMASTMVSDSASQALFERASAYVTHPDTGKKLKLREEHKLALYANFKQATAGDCDIPRPGMLDFVGRAKWDAWDRLRSSTRADARSAYIECVDGLCPGWRDVNLSESTNSHTEDALDEDIDSEEGEEPSPRTDSGGGVGGFFSPAVSTLAAVKYETEPEGWNDGEEAIFAAASDGNQSKLEDCIIAHPACIHLKDPEGRTPLHFACDRGNYSVAEVLLSAGAVVDETDSDGQTSLHYACTCGYVDIVSLLVSAGGHVLLEDSNGDTPLSLSSDADVTRILEQHIQGGGT